MENRTGYAVFSAICLFVSACFMVLSLLCCVKMQSLGERSDALAEQCRELEDENRILSVRLERKLPLSELEEYAVEVLNMHAADGSEVYHLEKTE